MREKSYIKNNSHQNNIRGGETKIMKKSLVVLLTLALVFTMVTPAFAATDLTVQEKFDALKAAGVLDGKNGEMLPADSTMDRQMLAKIACQLAGVAPTPDVEIADYAGDYKTGVWGFEQGWLQAAYTAGLMTGGEVEGVYTANAKGSVSMGHLLTVVLRAMGHTDLVETGVWYKVYVDKAVELGLVPAGTDGAANATYGDLVQQTYTANEALSDVPAAAMSVAATGAKELTVTFDGAVDTALTVKKGSINTTVSSVEWNSAKTVATVTLASKLYKGTYTVTAGDLTADLTVESEKVASIDILSDKASFTSNAKVVEVSYAVANQYGEDITKITSLQTSSTGGTVTLANGVATITSASDFILGQSVVLTLIHAETATAVTKTLTVAPQAKIAEVAITSLYNADNKTLTTDSTVGDFMLVVDAKDQYGNAVTSTARLNAELLVSVSNAPVVSVDTLVANRAAFSTVTIDGTPTTVLKLADDATPGLLAGQSAITLIADASGKSAQFVVTVADGVAADQIVFGDVGLVAAGETVKIPVTVTDKNGNEVTNPTIITGDVNVSASAVGLTASFIKESGVVYYQTTTPVTKGPLTLTAITSTSKVAIKTIDVKDPAVPTVITGLDSLVSPVIFNGETLALTSASLNVEDQYGRTMTDADFLATLADGAPAPNDYQIKVAEANSTGGAVASDVTVIDNNTSKTATISTNAKGSEAITFTLQKYTTSWADVAASPISISFRDVVQTELVSYGVTDIETTFKNTNYTKDIKVYGLTSDGSKAYLPATAYNVTATKALDVTTTAGKVDPAAVTGLSADIHEVTGTISVVINSTGDVITKDVIVSNIAPSVALLEVRKNNVEVSSLSATGASFDPSSAIFSNIYAEDQYGFVATVATGSDTATFKDTSTSGLTYVFSNIVDGKADGTAPAVTANGLAGAILANLGAGDSFDLTIYSGSQSATVHININ